MGMYGKKDCRNNGSQIKTPISKYPKLVKGSTWFTGKNRHERRAEAASQKIAFRAIGKIGFKLLRNMLRTGGVKETVLLMRGVNRGMRFHEGFPKMGAYTKEGFKLSVPKGVK